MFSLLFFLFVVSYQFDVPTLWSIFPMADVYADKLPNKIMRNNSWVSIHKSGYMALQTETKEFIG